MADLNPLFPDAHSFIKTEFNLQLQKSRLKAYSHKDWQKFCQFNGFDDNSEGLYIPSSYSAYVKTDSPFLLSNIFHELYGHGLFCEHSQIGKRLVDIANNRGDCENFLFDEVNIKEQPLGLAKHNIHNYEGFAIWLEALLCEETGNSKIWQLKKDILPTEFISLFEFFQDAEQKLSRFGLISQMGLPKFYNNDNLLDIIRRLYDSDFGNIDFIVLYGSQKPESDIDLFIVSTNPSRTYFNGWLDIFEINKNEFSKLHGLLDVSITDPLLTGKLIYGDEKYFYQKKNQLQSHPITKSAILYNMSKANEQKALAKQYPEGSREYCIGMSYSETYKKNALALKQGKRKLTKKLLLESYD